MLFECSNCTRTQSGINAFYNRFNEPKVNKNIASWIVLSKIMWIAWTSHTCSASNTFHSHNMKSLLALVCSSACRFCRIVCACVCLYVIMNYNNWQRVKIHRNIFLLADCSPISILSIFPQHKQWRTKSFRVDVRLSVRSVSILVQ